MKQKKKYNIVLMVSDDHGRESLGCYGNPAIDTPHLDALAADGTRFTNAFCTSASSSPSRSAILTGIHNHTNGTYGLSHAQHHFSCFDSVVSLPARMQSAGYRTGRAGKKHFSPENLFPFDFNLPENHLDRNDIALAEACREFISGGEPFFLYWCSFNPHRCVNVDESSPYKPNRFGNPAEAYPGDTERFYTADEVIVPPFLSDLPEVRAELAQYYQSISRLDRGIGRLIEILKEEGKYDDTLIIYISDNGAAFPASKTTLYDPGMQLPCIVKAPQQKETGIACDALVSWVDLTPTILDFAGALPEDSKEFHGMSFRNIIEETSPENWREEVFAAHTFHEVTNYYPMRIIRSKKYKFIWNIAHPLTYPSSTDLWHSASWQAAIQGGHETFGVRKVNDYLHRPRFELYNLENDPDEINNLAGDPEYAEQVAEYCEKLKAFQTETSDPWRHKWIYE
ncbi:MAG: sulfatase [Kiritimatiellales bacterium]